MEFARSMPTVSYDGRGFKIDHRRLWLAAGAIHYARLPRSAWRDRIALARNTGLNCVEVPVVWALHEPRPERFHFDQDADLRHFIELIEQAGLHAIVRLGPYTGPEYDFGGLPGWLAPIARTREPDPRFLERVSRFIRRLMEQIGDLQATTPSRGAATLKGGDARPILLFQLEHEWTCQHDIHGQTYLGELRRFLRENGGVSPIALSNNLWQRLDGTIDRWHALSHFEEDLRQLRAVQPDTPLLATAPLSTPRESIEVEPDAASGDSPPWADPAFVERLLGSILASGGQFTIDSFAAGVSPAALTGRWLKAGDPGGTAAAVANASPGAPPVGATGAPAPTLATLRRLATFATQFGRVFAQIDPELSTPTVASPASPAAGYTVMPLRGAAGEVIFVFRRPPGRPGKGAAEESAVDLLLRDGTTTRVHFGEDHVAWVLRGVALRGRVELTISNLRPWAEIGDEVLVLYGPAGSEGRLSLDGADMAVTVPTDDQPTVVRHGGKAVVVLNLQQVDHAIALPDRLIVGCDRLTADDEPIPEFLRPGAVVVDGRGEVEPIPGARPAKRSSRRSPKPGVVKLDGWTTLPATAWVEGLADAYEPIEGPAPLESLAPEAVGGWYRFKLRSSVQGKVVAPGAGDRVTLFQKGEAKATLGDGPGATRDPVGWRGGGEVVAMAMRQGRLSQGWRFGELSGLPRDLHTAKPVKLGEPKQTAGEAIDPFTLRGYWPGLRHDTKFGPTRLGWTLRVGSASPLLIAIDALPHRAAILVNDELIGMYDPHLSAGRLELWVSGEPPLKPRSNRLELAFESPPEKATALTRCLTVTQAAKPIVDPAHWAFAPLVPPDAEAFAAASADAGADQPGWHRATFKATRPAPATLDVTPLSHGVAWLNGHDLGRYGVPDSGTGDKKYLVIPLELLNLSEANELVIFDEQGANPSRCQLLQGWQGPFAGSDST